MLGKLQVSKNKMSIDKGSVGLPNLQRVFFYDHVKQRPVG